VVDLVSCLACIAAPSPQPPVERIKLAFIDFENHTISADRNTPIPLWELWIDIGMLVLTAVARDADLVGDWDPASVDVRVAAKVAPLAVQKRPDSTWLGCPDACCEGCCRLMFIAGRAQASSLEITRASVAIPYRNHLLNEGIIQNEFTF